MWMMLTLKMVTRMEQTANEKSTLIDRVAQRIAKDTGMDVDVVGCALTNFGMPNICPPLHFCKTKKICESVLELDISKITMEVLEDGTEQDTRCSE